MREGKRTALLALVLLIATSLTAATTPPSQSEALAARVGSLIDAHPFEHAIWGVVIEEEDGRILYERNRNRFLMPASVRKLFSAVSVAACQGLDATIPTELWTDGAINHGVLHGNLAVRGFGDPSLAGRYYDADRDRAIAELLSALQARGVRAVDGDVIADVSAFDDDTLPGSWHSGDIGESYAAPVDALAWNENVVGVKIDDPACAGAIAATDPAFVPVAAPVRCGTDGRPRLRTLAGNRVVIDGMLGSVSAPHFADIIAVNDASLYTAQAIRDALVRNGIDVAGIARASREPRVWRERLATHQSPPLYMLLSTMLKVSQNLYAEMLVKRLALGPLPASYAAATAIESDILAGEAGVAPDEISFSDGSGLSSFDLVTPRAIIAVLRWMQTPPRRELWWSMLATPGETGTLRKRLLELQSRMRGKTGTIYGVNALAGMVRMPDGSNRYFAVVVNHNTGEANAATKVIDAVVREIAK